MSTQIHEEKQEYSPGSRSTKQYNNWRFSVLEKYDYRCAKCNSEYNVVAHHKILWKDDISKRFDVDNGIALCRYCHSIEHGFAENNLCCDNSGENNGRYLTGEWVKILKSCVICGKLSRIYSYQNCCSSECGYIFREKWRLLKTFEETYAGQHLDHRAKELKKCVVCGKELLIGVDNQTCSRECGYKLRENNYIKSGVVINSGTTNGMYKTGENSMILKACIVCGKLKKMLSRSVACSYECSGIYRSNKSKYIKTEQIAQ